MNAYTLWSLLKSYEIEIPMIQRDYAQGREEDKVPFIRLNILKRIHEALADNGKPLDFDFVYGRIEKSHNGEKLIPIDGQQRLTTLFLLHWYFAVKESIPFDMYERLSKFSYNTRIASKSFCAMLINSRFSVGENKDSISEQIRDSFWFIMAWEKDPTVKSMLVMLDAIEHEFPEPSDTFFDKLTTETGPAVYFHFSDMKSLRLDDETYIKMNSRGKQLTAFENFKSRFEQYLEKQHPSEYEVFKCKVDSEWTDFFWKHCGNSLFDYAFMNFLEFILEIIHYQKESLKSETYASLFNIDLNDPDFWKPYLSEQEHVRFFIACLDTIRNWDAFTSCFSFVITGPYQEGNVCLFTDKVDLLSRCTQKIQFGIPEKVLLYYCLTISNKMFSGEVAREEIARRFRILRNLLQGIRQVKWPTFASNLRYEYFHRYLADVDIFVGVHGCIDEALVKGLSLTGLTAYLPQEVEKSQKICEGFDRLSIERVEDDPLFKGLIHNFLIGVSREEINDLYMHFTKIWNPSGGEIVIHLLQALIAHGFAGADMGLSTLGERWFWGSQENWSTVLTSDADKCPGLNLPGFLRAIRMGIASGKQIIGTLEAMKQEALKEYNVEKPKDWKYYFLTYPEILGTEECQFSWNNDFEIRRLTTKTARGYHINPYVFAVSERMRYKGSTLVNINNCYGLGCEHAPLRLTNGVQLYCEPKGWRLIKSFDCNTDLSRIPGIIELQNGEFLLEQTEMEDRILIAEQFIEQLKC